MAKCPGVYRRGESSFWWFRRRVPQDLLPHYLPRKELAHSLETTDYRTACEKARLEYVRLDQEFAEARRKLKAKPAESLSKVEIQRIAALIRHDMLEEDEAVRVAGMGPDYFERLDIGLDAQRDMLNTALIQNDTSKMSGLIEEYQERLGFRLSPDSQSYKELAYAILLAATKATEELWSRNQGQLVETPPCPAIVRLAVQPQEALDGELTFSGLFDKWTAEKRGTLPETTIKDFRVYIRRFIELHGDLPLTLITKTHVREYKDAMLKLPSVIRLTHEYRGLTVPELLELAEQRPDLERLSARTVNDKALGAVGAVLSWGEDNGYLESNPARRVKVAQGVRNKAHVPYSVDDLNMIFSFPVFTEGERPKGGAGEAAKWLPLLALFTGARLQELGRLQTEDVREEWGVLFFDLTTAGTKTETAKRVVPVHPELIRLGFLTYVAERRKAGGGPLFPALKSGQDSPTEGWSKWWGRYARKHGITDKRKVFHSFRHLVKDGFRNNGVERALADALQGHAVPGVGQEYGEGHSLKVKAEALAKLQYPGLDLEHLVPRPSCRLVGQKPSRQDRF